ncbi:MAG: portal protein, partial [Candidatus Kariarchaeaceae archaeon]
MARNNNNNKNPNNNQSPLYKALTRIFSGPIVQRRTQTGRQLRRRELDKYSSRFKSASGLQFKKSEYNPMNVMALNMIQNRNRSERYVDFDQMEYTPEIASSLDIYADEMTTHSSLTPMLNIKCANEEIKFILHSLYYDILNVNSNLFGWARTMCKYGDFFLYLDIDEHTGIRNCIGLPPQEVERMEGQDESNPNYVQFQWNSGGLTFENWQIAHFRILGNDKYAPYGTSALEPARRIWRQLTLLEDAMMAYRIIRATDRRIFKIDVGGIAPQEVEQYMQKIMTQMKRHQVVDPTTGRVDLRYNPLSIEEDYFIPVKGGQSSTDIVNLPGGTFTSQIEDVKYLRDKLFSALKIPQSYLSMGDGATEDKTTLAQKDIRFARTIQRLQRVVVSELEKVGVIHLFTLGFRGDDLLNFDLSLNNPSKIAEMQELEHWKTKFDIAAAATEG